MVAAAGGGQRGQLSIRQHGGERQLARAWRQRGVAEAGRRSCDGKWRRGSVAGARATSGGSATENGGKTSRPASESRCERGGGDAGEPRMEAGERQPARAWRRRCRRAANGGRHDGERRPVRAGELVWAARASQTARWLFRRVCRGRASNMSDCS